LNAATAAMEMWMKKRLTLAAALAGIVLMTVHPAAAQDATARPANMVTSDQPSADENIRLFRKDVRSLKKQIISANIQLTDAEAQQFWPVYDRYTAEIEKIEDSKFELLKEYARNYSTITDEQADAYIKGRTAVEESVLQLRLKYLPEFRKVLSGRTAALFTQMDFRLGLVVELQLASQVPMIEP
jgi:Spy/CpxP family protein refolding chaperone